MQNQEKQKKQVLLRISSGLWQELVVWSEEEFRSLNGQIEYLLSDCVRRRKNRKKETQAKTDAE